MKSLVLDQPAPTLIKEGVKTLVLVDKPTEYRGRVLIHASDQLPPVDEDCYGEVGPVVWYAKVYDDGSRRLEYWIEATNYIGGWRHEDLIIDSPVTTANIEACLPVGDGWPIVHEHGEALRFDSRLSRGGCKDGLYRSVAANGRGGESEWLGPQIQYEDKAAWKAAGRYDGRPTWALMLTDVRDVVPDDLEPL